MLGDLRPHRAPDVESPVMETLGPGREIVTVIGQYSLLEGWILAGGLGGEVLAGLLCGSGEEGRQDVCPLVLRPALSPGGPLKTPPGRPLHRPLGRAW